MSRNLVDKLNQLQMKLISRSGHATKENYSWHKRMVLDLFFQLFLLSNKRFQIQISLHNVQHQHQMSSALCYLLQEAFKHRGLEIKMRQRRCIIPLFL